jgi:hypothetical protein
VYFFDAGKDMIRGAYPNKYTDDELKDMYYARDEGSDWYRLLERILLGRV